MRTVVVVVVAAAVVVVAVDGDVVVVDYYVGLVDCVAGVVEAGVVVVAVAVDGRQLPLCAVGVDDGLAGVGAAVVGVHQWDKATDVPGAGLVT